MIYAFIALVLALVAIGWWLYRQGGTSTELRAARASVDLAKQAAAVDEHVATLPVDDVRRRLLERLHART